MRLRKSVLAAGALAAAMGLGVSATSALGASSGPYVSANPDHDLTDGQVIRVSGGGYSPNASMGIVQCKTGSTSISDCEGDTATSFSADASGRFSKQFTARRVISIYTGSGQENIDCAVPGSCEIVSVYIHGFAGKASAPLHFAG